LAIENMYLEDGGKIVAELLEIELILDPGFFHSTLDTKE